MPDDLKSTIGARVQAMRSVAGMTQEGLAAKIDRTPESVSNIERGKQLPGLDTLSDLATALNVPLVTLLADLVAPRSISAERASMEARLDQICRQLTDADLRIALRQIEAFLGPRG
ncbi:helix-turn-helix transcriptional regulator [Phreatobacter stygius]|uniref:Helix-turn-helix transcriptional regulator n=2 Tax=Phreatobacter stygius TaxID=1940610 RepID=A0A4D7BND7_9HYPH|nr:helix-turn-helix transcriptional regulator [Phreatobacter stygius]